MSEIKLKFQVPSSKIRAFHLAFGRKKPTLVQLSAQYFDTADHDLYQHHIRLRQRLENGIWIQSLNAPKNQNQCYKIHIQLGTEEPSTAELQHYNQQKQLKKQLIALIIQTNKSLKIQFKTQTTRQFIVQKTVDEEFKLTFDQIKVFTDQESISVNEILFELQQGNVHRLVKMIQPWVEKYQIWLDYTDITSKGHLLKQSSESFPVQYQTELKLNADVTVAEALPQIISNCLKHLLPNYSAITHQQFSTHHIHQARVAIRRLRSAIKTFEPLFHCDTKHWQEQLTLLFRHLGNTRDRDALAESLIPQLIQAGSPIIELPCPQIQNNADISVYFRAPETTLLLLDLIDFSHSTQPNKNALKKHIHKYFNEMHLKISQASTSFTHMQLEEKHQLRKQVKRLRYSIEFITTLYPQKAVKAYLKTLKPLQENLGHFNDLTVAYTLFEQNLKQQPEAWFVLGWISAEQHHIEQQIQQNLDAFSQVEGFW